MSDFLGYEGKRVIVSGCFSGMGHATAKQLLSLGAEVHGLDYKECTLNLASFTHVDLRDSGSIDNAVKKIGGRVDALFNCAGLPQTFPPLDVMKVNYLGTRHLTEAVLPLMSGNGAVASISSTAGMGWSQRVPLLRELLAIESGSKALAWCEAHMDDIREGYALSKELIIYWTMMSSFTLINRGIRINCTLPGPTQTPMMAEFEAATPPEILEAALQPINRRSTPEEQAAALIFLNSSGASYVNGHALPVDGGFFAGLATGQIDPSFMMAMAKG
jgi:NAD(P)-dependent dehydrogenase (short-subunit alcohol dehydrogenase family)